MFVAGMITYWLISLSNNFTVYFILSIGLLLVAEGMAVHCLF